MNPDPKLQTLEEWRIYTSERIAKLETKMNIIAFLSGGTFLLVAGDLIRLMIAH